MRKSDSLVKNQSPDFQSENKSSPAVISKGTFAGSSIESILKLTNVYEHGYDPLIAEQCVRPDRLVLDPRFWRIFETLRSFTMASWQERKSESLSKEARSAHRRKRARHLTQTLIDLGPTFIKLGQFFSVRRDFLPAELSEELALLQDRVPPFSSEQVRQTVRSELGYFPEDIFLSFDLEPIASASIGQVHKATLTDGRIVAVKIQRPNLAAILYQDLGCMRWFAKFSKLLHLEGDWDSWLELSDEFGKTLFEEIDYIKEGRNADRIRFALRDHSEIVIPRVMWKHTSRRVITLEFIDGTKIDKIRDLSKAGYNLEKIGKQLIACYMDQVLSHGFFHADPHAGNLAVTSEGRIVIYDFGMVGEISNSQREALLGCISDVVNKNPAELTKHLLALGVIKQTANVAPIERALQPFIDYYSGRSVRDLDFSHLEKDIDQIAIERALRLPPTLAYLIRTGASLEGIARTLKPDFSFIDAAKPALQKWVMNQPSQAAGILKAIYRHKVNLLDEPKRLAITDRSSNGKGDKRAEPLVPPRIIETQPRKPAIQNGAVANNGATKADSTPSTNGKGNHAPKMMISSVSESANPAKIYNRIEELELELKKRSERSNQSALFVVIQLVLNVFYWLANIVAKVHFDTNMFLIGNALMGAIILWQLVAKPGSLIKRSNRPGE
jgi:predicted unusual protein kinase regulating ubiquinone biosynthesis (AarF/ABC1/UbiB family)